MELQELQTLCFLVKDMLHRSLPGYTMQVSVEYPESPNPLCFFEIDGPVFAQGSFWANNEFCIEAMHTVVPPEIMHDSSAFYTCSQALDYVRELCERANAGVFTP